MESINKEHLKKGIALAIIQIELEETNGDITNNQLVAYIIGIIILVFTVGVTIGHMMAQ